MNTRLNDIEISMHLLDESMRADIFEFNSISQNITKWSLIPTVDQINVIADRYETKLNEWKKLDKEKKSMEREPVDCRADERIDV
jgi:hypothetical protein